MSDCYQGDSWSWVEHKRSVVLWACRDMERTISCWIILSAKSWCEGVVSWTRSTHFRWLSHHESLYSLFRVLIWFVLPQPLETPSFLSFIESYHTIELNEIFEDAFNGFSKISRMPFLRVWLRFPHTFADRYPRTEIAMMKNLQLFRIAPIEGYWGIWSRVNPR